MAEPTPEEFAAVVEEVLRDPEYRLDVSDESLKAAGYVSGGLEWLNENVLRPFLKSASELMETSPVMWWTAVLIAAGALLLILAEAAWSVWVAVRRRRAGAGWEEDGAAPPPDAERCEAEAERAAAAGDYLTALRRLLQGAMLRLDRGEMRRAATNRQYLRRFANTAAGAPLGRLVGLVDAKWYGREPCEPGEWDAARAAAKEVRLFVDARDDALPAPAAPDRLA